jgi:beta propeller repeat protein
MRAPQLPTLTTPILVISIMLPMARASQWEEFAVWPAGDDQEHPDVWGQVIVWHQFMGEYGDYDVYVVDINDLLRPYVLDIGDANDQMYPAIFEDTIVWQNYVVWEDSADWDIWAADIRDRNEPHAFVVSGVAYNDEALPAVHGSTVVWRDSNGGDFNIYGADITNPSAPIEFPVADFAFDQNAPGVWRTTVVWQDNVHGDWDIFAADIWRKNKPEELPVVLLEHNQENPVVCGDIVVWQDDLAGNWDIRAADISYKDKPAEFGITTDKAQQINPDVDGNLVVWQDYRNGNWDIFGYNLTTHRRFRVTDNPYDQVNPAVNGNIVVWQDNRDGTWNIYAVVLDGPAVARCASEMLGDVNGDCRVDLGDVALMAASWLDCHLVPEGSCRRQAGPRTGD